MADIRIVSAMAVGVSQEPSYEIEQTWNGGGYTIRIWLYQRIIR